MRLVEPTSGSVRLDGKELATLSVEKMRAHRRAVQIIFQDPYASLSPRLTAGENVAEPLQNFGRMSTTGRRERQQCVLDRKIVVVGESVSGRVHMGGGVLQ